MKTLTKSIILFLTVASNVVMTASLVSANEVMTDRCSRDVAFVPNYDDNPGTPGTIVLTRATTAWTPDIKVGTSSGYIRWWCNNTQGNFADIGTWRPEFDPVETVACITGGIGLIINPNSTNGKTVLGQCAGAVTKIGSSAWQGWTPERSRCRNRSTKIRARLGSDRLLQIECRGN